MGLGLGKTSTDVFFGKVIFLADPDVDGKHINCLLLTLFWKFAPSMFKDGKIFMLKSPEFHGEHKGVTYFADTVAELQQKAGTSKIEARHIKGWGELTAQKMAPIAFEPENRELIRILPPRDTKGGKNFEALMGKNAVYRQKLLGVTEL